ncbi:MAG: hypothetical protein KKE04_00515, partial [Candidatus Thermoplasmatota archaeon]|nr:hypothetical protein [Candidatus Thermoplasmatota archaeon]
SEIMNETWIVSYNFEGEQRVNFSGLDDGDNKVTIKLSAGINVTVYFPEDGDIGVPHYPTSTVGDEFSFARDLIGTVYIRVNTTIPQKTLAELWLFDVTPITYELSSASGTYYIKSVNGGIITQATGQKYVTNEPLVKETGSSLLLYMIQTKATNLRSGGSGSYSFTLNMKNMNIRNNMSKDVFNLTLQIYDKSENDWDKAWYSYFTTGWENAEINGEEKNYTGFAPDEGGDGLLYKTEKTDKLLEYGTKPITLKLMSCNIDVNMKSM